MPSTFVLHKARQVILRYGTRPKRKSSSSISSAVKVLPSPHPWYLFYPKEHPLRGNTDACIVLDVHKMLMDCIPLVIHSLGDFKLARIKAPRAGDTKMVRCVDGMGSLLRALTWFHITNSSPAMISVVPAPARGEVARVQAWLRWACQKREDVSKLGVVEECRRHGASQKCREL